MGTISLDYEKVMVEVARLKTIANELNTLNRNAQNTLKDMSSYWEGDAAREFLAVNEKWRKEMKSIEKEAAELAILIAEERKRPKESDRIDALESAMLDMILGGA